MEKHNQYSDESLVGSMEDFSNKYAMVNNVNIHYVEGGQGTPLILLSGWPQNWYSFHRIMPQLAKKYEVIAVDYRGMGTSGKPEDGYDKKTLARDIYELIKYLGYEKVYIAGHDIGAMVAYSFAANYPAATIKLILMDATHPSEMMLKMPMIPAKGTFTEKMNPQAPYGFWMSFNQVKGLPEQLLEDRFYLLQDWLYNYVMIDPSAMEPFERQVYAAAYNNADAIRASNGWYQTFTQDIEDESAYGPLEMPVLGIGGNIGGKTLKMSLSKKAPNLKTVELENCGHFILEEKPAEVLDLMIDFLG
ncbi:alpha/beta fold hydrolase [Pedobacter sp. L105]|uniref:alpha/beta fold hydrolase n=1 Tax=Pedobacter sp. L105 TaxID=1641871 RepID=UPI00131DF37C|nr:alpha/beta hydrolase [Pedobacter sp. L105]